MVEHLFYTQRVVGSNPTGVTKYRSVAQLEEHRSSESRVAGSIPVTPALWECRLMEGPRSSKSICVGSSPTIPAKSGAVTQLGEYLFCKQKVRGSSPLSSTVTVGEAAPLELPKVVAGLVCETSISEFNSRRSPQMEDAAKASCQT
jgi:hypothetical protein